MSDLDEFGDDTLGGDHEIHPTATAQANDRYRPGVTIELSEIECRVLGSLIEKAALTPEIYPMTTNALVSACNQKTNRHPVVDLSAVQIDHALMELRQRNLVRRVHTPGSRATKHRQTLDEVLELDAGELAVLSVLMLRGTQTVGELRLRTDRQHSFDELDAVEACLQALAARGRPLVRQLQRQPGHKEPRWQQLLSDHALSAAEPDQAAGRSPTSYPQSAAAPGRLGSPGESGPDPLEARMLQLESEVATLRRQLTSLAAQLGEELDG